MTDENTEDHLTEGEREFFKSRGEAAIPQGDTEPKVQPEGETPPTEEASGDGESQEKRSAGEGDGEAGKRQEGTVDRHALDAERKRRKDAEERLRQQELLAVRMEERFKAYVDTTGERRQQQQPQNVPAPKPSEDIFGAVDHTIRTVGEINKKVAEYEKNERDKAQAAELVNWAQAHEQAFAQENPDYVEARSYLRQGRSRELQAWGLQGLAANGAIIPGSPIANQIQIEERQLLMRAAQGKVSPAQVAYNLAMARGYTKAAPKAPAGDDAGKQLDRIEAGKKAGSSMAGVGGRTGGSGEVTLADLVAMPDNEFIAFKNRNPAKFRRLKGATH